MEFRAGQRVRCVNRRGWIRVLSNESVPEPDVGDVCVVARVVSPEAPPQYAGDYLMLEGHGEAIYPAGEFRPLQDDQIDALAAICADPPLKARELAEAL